VHPSDRPVLGEPALARAQVDLPPAVAALRPGDPLEDRRADPGPEAVHPFIIGAVLVISAISEEYMMQLAGRATAASAEQAESSGAR
jgi:hypothetical protein